jgi:uncharacterized lipoprotein YmbA
MYQNSAFACTRTLAIASFLLLLPGCVLTPKQDPARYYVLPVAESAAPAEKAPPPDPADVPIPANLNIVSFRIPAYLDRSELVWHTTGNRVAISDTDLWLEPLSKSAARVFAHDLARRLGVKSVSYPPAALPLPQALQVSVDIFQFQIHPNTEVLLQANWQLTGPDKFSEDGTSTLRVPLPANSGLDTSVRAMSTALDQLAAEITQRLHQRKK